MTDIEAEQFIMRCRTVLPKWQREIEGAVDEAKSEAEAARDSLLDMLREISVDLPAKAAPARELVKGFAKSEIEEVDVVLEAIWWKPANDEDDV